MRTGTLKHLLPVAVANLGELQNSLALGAKLVEGTLMPWHSVPWLDDLLLPEELAEQDASGEDS